MRFKIQLPEGKRLVGFAAENARASDKYGSVVAYEMLTTDDGERLVSRLTEISGILREHAPPSIAIPHESSIGEIILLMTVDGGIDVWLNEPGFLIKSKVRRDVAAGETVYEDDFADIAEMVPSGLAIPDDAGVVILFSAGWRKALYFDLRPLLPEPVIGQRRLSRVLAGLFSYLRFRDRFSMTGDQWTSMLEQKWFPFIGLPAGLVRDMVNHAKAKWEIDDLLPRISEATRNSIPTLLKEVDASPLFARHRKLIREALSTYERGEHAITAGAIYPRIEGILREHHALVGKEKPSPQELIKSAIGHREQDGLSLLLPHQFKEYLSSVFFRGEDFTDPAKVQHVTRHAVAHGVADDRLLDEKAATIGVLLIQQLAYLLPGVE